MTEKDFNANPNHLKGGLAGLALLQSSRTAWLILLASLLLTAIAWFLSHNYIRSRASDRFRFRSDETRDLIAKRMTEYEQVLRGALGLLQASENVTREEWHTYIENSELQKYFPGIQGIGVSEFVEPEDRTEYVQRVRDGGFSDFDIKPPGERERYSSIIFLEPFDWRNQRAFGYDMYSDETRRNAMDQAIKTGDPAISGKVTLVQETAEDPQDGFLFYLPVYKKGESLDSEQDRFAATEQFIYAVFRVNDLMSGILESELPDIKFEIFDGPEMNADTLLYDSDNLLHLDPGNPQPTFKELRQISLRGRTWTLYFETQPEFMRSAESLLSTAVAIGGLIVDALLFLVINAIGRQRSMAVKLAEGMTEELRSTQQKFQAVSDNAHQPIVVTDAEGTIKYANPATSKVFGYSESELKGLLVHQILQFDMKSKDTTELSDERSNLVETDSKSDNSVIECRRKDGKPLLVKASISDWKVKDVQFWAYNIRDVTDEEKKSRLIKQTVQELRRSNRDLDDFAYIASHDLRSPLRNVDSLASWVIEDSADVLPEESKKNLLRMKSRIQQMNQLLDDLLKYARAGNLLDHVSTVDTKLLLDQVVSSLSKPERFRIELDDALPEFSTLAVPLQTCLRNLISNAIQHHDRDNGVVRVSAECLDKFYRFDVADDGPGIEKNFQDRIFKIFQTLRSKTDLRAGSGVGLAIVKKTVETFGGRVNVVSEPGQGACFQLFWPKHIEASNL